MTTAHTYCETRDEAVATARRLSQETGDLYPIMPHKGKFLVYLMGFCPTDLPSEDEDDEDI